MKQLILISILLLGFIPVGTSVTSNLSNSSITPSSSVVGSLENITIVVYAANNTDPVAGVNVNLQSTDGSFFNASGQTKTLLNSNSLAIGVTNGSGFITFDWQAPNLSITDLEIIVAFNATLDVDSVIIDISTQVKVQDDLSSISGSELKYKQNVASNETIVVGVDVKSSSGVIKEGAEVELDIPEGTFITSKTGQSDKNGNFSSIWQAPALTIEIPTLNLSISAKISVGLMSYNLTGYIVMVLSANATKFKIELTGPSLIQEDTVHPIMVRVLDENDNPLLTEVEVSASDGIISKNVLVTNSSGYALFNYTAPLLATDENVISTIGATVTIGLVSNFSNLDITIFPIIDNFNISWSIPEIIKQGNKANISISVKSNKTGLPISNASVLFTSDLGLWSNGKAAILIQTNEKGIAKEFLDTNNTVLVNSLQRVNLEVTVSKIKFEEFTGTATLKVNRTNYSINLSANLNIDTGIIIARIVGDQITNVSLELSASAGNFNNNKSAIVNRTNSTGYSSFKWLYELPESFGVTVSEIVIIFRLRVLSPNYIADDYIFNVTLTSDGLQSTQNPSQNTEVSDNINTNLLIGGIVTLVLLGGVAIFITKKAK